ncbi:MAG: DUF2961 domain-containing protein [Pirellulales bacterium]|nr:DUF2961 domain-containing protein [Pirellulales bacterium]
MMKRIDIARAAVLTAALVCLSASPLAAQQTLTYPDLVHHMIDLEGLATLPAPGETCQQWSSYDRASRYDEATGKYVHWDANNDGPMFIRQEGKVSVMAEMEGPGCIWRVWSALTDKGHVKIYLDGQREPAIDLPFNDYFTGKAAPLDYPTLSYALEDQGCRGKNLYLPIPYQKSCKIVAEEGWGRYYHFTYTTFPEGTTVPTFRADPPAGDVAALKRLDALFRNRLGNDPAGPRDGEETIAETIVAPAGETQTLDLAGPRAITAIRGKMQFGDRADEMAALRQLVLKITFDDQRAPAVWCPLGDFFGTAPGVNRFKSLPVGMTEDGFYSFWYMPFAKGAKVELVNEGKVDRQLQYEITHAPLSRPFDQLGHFHCKWHRDVFPLSRDRWPDWVMLRTEGRGRFCGVMLHVWNPRGGWWGEGDEKFFVDGEKFPSTIGTGSEDYFGYAWGHPHLFQTPFHCQTMTEDNRGHQSLLRWHIADNVPFQGSFEGCIEKYFGNDRGTLFACVACWYLAPGGSDPLGPSPVDQRHGYCVVPPVPPANGGGFKVLGDYRGAISTQALGPRDEHKWAGGDQLWWTGARPGDKIVIILPVKRSGVYQVAATMTKAKDYGIVQFSIDGKKADGPIDLYNPEIVRTEPVPLGVHELNQGDHKITVEIVGANEKAIKGYMFGLDQILLKSN